jgi:transcriptional regulator with XRE-family HTH domain
MSVRNATLSGLGARLRELRTKRGLSVRTLAARTGFSPSFISQVEMDAVSPSLASLERIAGELGVTLGQLFTSLESAPRTVVHRAERTSYKSVWSRSTVEVLADAVPGRKMSAVQVTIEPGGASGKRAEPNPHETFALVLAGALILTTEEGSVELAEGDAAYVPEGVAFSWENHGEERAELLVVGTAGTTDVVSGLLAEGAADPAREKS